VNKTSSVVRAATWSARHPWRAVTAWIVLVVVCVGLGATTGTREVASRDFWIGEAGRAEAIAAEGGLTRRGVERVLITGDGPRDVAAQDVVRRMHPLPGVAEVADPITSADGAAVLVAVTLDVDEVDADAHVEPLLAQTAAVQATYPQLGVEQTGNGSVGQGVGERLSGDLARAELVVLPITFVILLVVFGSVLAAVVPLVLALTSVVAAFGLMAVTSHVVPSAGGAVADVVVMMGLAVGVDYTLFFLKRVREERTRGTVDRAAAVEVAIATAGRALVVSGIAVVASLLGLYLVGDVIFSSMATAVVGVVALALVSSVTVLVLLGPRLDARRHPRRPGALWPALLRPATGRPVATLVLAGSAMLLLALPVVALRLAGESTETYPRTIPAVETHQQMIEEFAATRGAHQVVVRVDGAADALAGVVAAIRGPATDTEPRIRTSADGRVGTLELPVTVDPDSVDAAASLQHLRAEVLPATLGQRAGAEYAVTGDLARTADYAAHQGARLPWVVGFVLAATFVVTLVAYRSVVIGLVGVGLNLLSAGAALGALVAVFQWGLFGVDATGFVGSRIPLILFVILFGLSMDYQIFVLSRISEAVDRGAPARKAVSEGVVASAGVVTSAAAVLVSVFTAFALNGVVELQQTGFGLALAVLLDAVVIRILILPAVLTLLGEAAWPSRGAPDRRTITEIGT